MLTRSKTIGTSAVEAPLSVADMPRNPALSSVPTEDVLTSRRSSAASSKSSDTTRARTLAVQAVYARKVADAERKIAEAERQAMEAELRAELAEIECEASNSCRNSSRASSFHGSSHYDGDKNIVQWISSTTHTNNCDFVGPCEADSSDAPNTVRPRSSALVDTALEQQTGANAPQPVRLGSPAPAIAVVRHRVNKPACRDVPCHRPLLGGPTSPRPCCGATGGPTSPRPCCGPTGDAHNPIHGTHLPLHSNKNSDFFILAQAIQGLNKNTSLPSFDGKILDWLAFKRAYDATKDSFSLINNLSRLNAALHGPARETVGALLATASDPSEIIAVLELQFGRPELIVLHEVAAVRALPKVNFEGKDLHHFAGRVRSCISVMKFLNERSYMESPELYNSILLKLTPAMRARWKDYANSRYNIDFRPKLELLADFLNHEVNTEFKFGLISEAHLSSQPHNSKTSHVNISNAENHKHNLFQNKKSKIISCPLCQNCHTLDNCDKFLQFDINSRFNFVRDRKVCMRCLKKGSHRYRSCNPKSLCHVAGCQMRHNKLLHSYESDNTHATTEEILESNPRPASFESKSEIVAHGIAEGSSKVLLKVIPVTVNGPKGFVNTYALLDDGSTSTFIDSNVSNKIGLEGPKAQLRVNCMGGLSKLTEVEYVDFSIKGLHSRELHKINNARSVSCLGIARQTVSLDEVRHLCIPNITYENAEPKLIIGIDNWNLLTPKEVRQGSKTQPAACLTPLGWAVFGFTSSRTKPIDFVNHNLTSDNFNDIECLIRENYKLDAIGISKREVRSAADDRATKILEDTAKRLPDGQFEVGLLWKSDDNFIPNSYPLALSRFSSLEKKFAKDKSYADCYRQNIQAMIDKGYAELCEISTNSPRVWYLPHFGVINPNKPGKLRVVHDAAARCQGICLNSLLLTGPDLLSSLLDIIFRFREGRVALTADIKEMFPQVKIRPEDRDAQRFLWRNSPSEPISVYRMSSMIFGAASSPFTALYIKNKNAEEHKGLYPEAAHAIVQDTYMDDFIGSLDNIQDAALLARDIVEVQKRAHFEVRGWTSNVLEALTLVPTQLRLDCSSQPVDIANFPQSVRTLGLIWYPSSDDLGFNANALKSLLNLSAKLTKRQALSSLMKVFDPLGILAPVTIRARILFQLVWRRKIDWDQELPQDLNLKWKAWLAEVPLAVNIRIPRWHLRESHLPDQLTKNILERELHLFCDASEQAYVAVAYWRFVFDDAKVQLSFICSKSRVTPLVPVTIPRLELQAAAVAARLAHTICLAHKQKPIKRYFWTDSKNVLGWLRSDARSFLPFVAHRIADILELSSQNEWYWVPTALNVADDATRTNAYQGDFSKSRWIGGPTFLKSFSHAWPVEPQKIIVNTSELKPSARISLTSFLINVDIHPIIKSVCADPTRFSRWLRLLRATARVYQFIRRLCGRASDIVSPSHTPVTRISCNSAQLPPVTAEDLRLAQQQVLLKSQEDSFPEELAALRLKEPLPRYSKVMKLDIVLGSDGLLKLSGRIGAVENQTSTSNNPILLDGSHPAIKLLIQHYHRRFSHGNNETVVNELRQHFWILNLRSSVRSVAHACQFCRIKKSLPQDPPVGNLPAARLAHHHRPFSFVGLDYFGPIIVTVGRKHEKRYVALYTCLTTRAVHLEIVHDLSTDAALMALRRFSARRGRPQQIWSDNGTAFVGASKFLRELYGPAIEDFTANQNIEWKFIPPSAPSMGGAWERLVRSVKTALKATLKEKAPKEHVLATLLLEAEAVVNSRPLTHVPVQPGDNEALTPFHFLIGSSSTGNDYMKANNHDLYGRVAWRKAIRLADLFWARWIKEYLPTLTPRRCNRNGNALPLCVGDLVLVVDSNLPRGTWPRGRVSRLFPGSDNIARVAEVTTSGGVLRRPCRKLVRLPV